MELAADSTSVPARSEVKQEILAARSALAQPASASRSPSVEAPSSLLHNQYSHLINTDIEMNMPVTN